jgi:hypothetical protein
MVAEKHASEAVSYMVVEKGLSYLYEGSWVEAGVLEGGPTET